MKIAIVTEDGEITQHGQFPTPESPVEFVKSLTHELRQLAGDEYATLQGIGIGFCGPVDRRGGVIRDAPNLPGYKGFPLVEELSQEAGLPVKLENDANVAGLAEHWKDPDHPVAGRIILTLGTGVSGAVVLDGRLLRGPDSMAAELGHICIDSGGRMCGCGGSGCLGAYVGSKGIQETWQQVVRERKVSPSRPQGSEPPAPREIQELAKQNDADAIETWKRTGRYLGIGMASLVNTFNPDLFVLGGKVSAALPFMEPSIKEELEARCFEDALKRLAFRASTLGDHTGTLGAAALVFESGTRITSRHAWSPLAKDLVLILNIGRTNTIIALGKTDGAAVGARKEFRTPRKYPLGVLPPPDDRAWPPATEILDRVIAEAKALLRESGTQEKDLLGISLVTPGVVRPERGKVFAPGNVPMQGIPDIPSYIQESGIEAHVVCCRDAHAAAYAELVFGELRKAQSAVVIHLATGMGGAVVEDGEIKLGWDGSAGELGHMKVFLHGRICPSCRSMGCWEAYASGEALCIRLEEMINVGGLPVDFPLHSRDFTHYDIGDLAQKRDPVCTALMDEIALFLALGLANLVHIVNPECIVVTGPFSRYWPLLERRTLDQAKPRCIIEIPGICPPADFDNHVVRSGVAAILEREYRERSS